MTTFFQFQVVCSVLSVAILADQQTADRVIGAGQVGAMYEIYPAVVGSQEEFEKVANSLKPGDEPILEDCEICQTGNNASTMNSRDCDALIIRRNHILSDRPKQMNTQAA